MEGRQRTASTNCRKMGDSCSSEGACAACAPRSIGATEPQRSANWWPNESHSLATSRPKPRSERKYGSNNSWASAVTCGGRGGSLRCVGGSLRYMGRSPGCAVAKPAPSPAECSPNR